MIWEEFLYYILIIISSILLCSGWYVNIYWGWTGVILYCITLCMSSPLSKHVVKIEFYGRK